MNSIIPYDYDELTQSNFSKSGVVPTILAKVQEQFRFCMITYSDSLREADVINNFIEGNHYSFKTLAELRDARRPAEAYNLILRITRLLTGYFKKVVTTAVAEGVTQADTETANLHNEHFKLAKRLSKWDVTMNRITTDLITTGQGAWAIKITATGRSDQLGRSINDISFKHVPSRQVFIDPRSTEPDKSDAKHSHYWEYMTLEDIALEFGQPMADKISMTHSDIDDYSETYSSPYSNDFYRGLEDFTHWKEGKTYYIVRSWVRDIHSNGLTEVVWHGDILIKTTILEPKIVPVMAIHLLNKRDTNRYYSPLFEGCASQDSINQALLAFGKLVGEERVIASNKAMGKNEVQAFQKKLKTIGDILHVKNIDGIKIVNLSGDAQNHLNKMYTSIQLIMQVIGINEAFLGESKAGDSGRKFEGQRSSSENTLDYIFTPLNLIYESMMKQCIHYTSIYKQATEYLRFTDAFGRSRWQEVNQPFAMPTGRLHEDGVPEVEFIETEVYNPTIQRWERAFINEKSKSLSDIAVEVSVHSAPYDDTDATELAFIEGLLNGTAGQIIASADPAGIPYLYSLLTANLKTRNSEEVSAYLTALSEKLGALDVHDPRLYQTKSFGASGGGANGQSQAGAGAMGSQGTQQNIGQQGQIKYEGGTTNDHQEEGYNQPKGEQ